MSEVAWDTIQDALTLWVREGGGLTQRHVIWNYWKAPRPAASFVELAITEIAPVGHDWRVYDDAPDPVPGAELRVTQRGHRTVQLTLQCFGATDQGDTAWPLLSQIVSSLTLHEDDIDHAGAGIGDVGAVTSVEGRKGGTLEPRARCQITLHVMSELEGRETFIERFEATVHVDGLADVPVTIP